jgi:NAD(P)-dependent dehydrogenase (short-subunit alcohol dehydrogenase family)
MIVHNASPMVLAPVKAFTPEQIADIYDVSVPGAQRVNRAAPYACGPRRRVARVGRKFEHARRTSAVSRALFRRERGYGRAGRELRR